MAENRLNRVDKAHIKHLVGLVEHNSVNITESDNTAVDKINQTAGRGDDNLYAFAQSAYLALDARAAIDRQHTQTGRIF